MPTEIAKQVLYDNVAIVGPGLIGASMGLAMKSAGLAGRVVGIGRRQVSLDTALRTGAVDEGSLDLEAGVAAADLVVIATPISTLHAIAPRVTGALREGAVLTEVSSVKRSVIRTIEDSLPPDACFIPTHPMAGSEQRGPEAARADLFRESICIFTPVASSTEAEVDRLERLWEAMGACVRTLTPGEHDRVVAMVSHMPHLVCSGLVEAIADRELPFAGTGLIDVTRIASSDPDLWVDICRNNREAVVKALSDLIYVLDALLGTVDRGDFDLLRSLLESSKQRRDALVQARSEARLGEEGEGEG